MEINKKSGLKVLLIGIAVGICFGALVGFIAGTFDLPMAVIIPAIVVPITYVSIVYEERPEKVEYLLIIFIPWYHLPEDS